MPEFEPVAHTEYVVLMYPPDHHQFPNFFAKLDIQERPTAVTGLLNAHIFRTPLDAQMVSQQYWTDRFVIVRVKVRAELSPIAGL